MIVPMICLKGGVGKTTTALALATLAARDGKRATVYDCDPQSSASAWASVAEDAGEPLPFEVRPANIDTVERLAKLRGDAGEWAFVDCPPSGFVADAAMRAADFVIVPTTPAPADMRKALETARTLSAAGVPHAVALTQADKRTIAYADAIAALEGAGTSYLDSSVPRREELRRAFGHAFGARMNGYGEVYAEVMRILSEVL